ncbi:MAG: hypothetical protein FRX48_05731 [Lasallia pustulata]|uniref:Major facilitator superfamily domain, general substrate transporter n=1 Tax=Lasallia pustulata TaxID=136370 RepID=A0A5M8PMZ7_9LECA|nr:MAG: hypothetical protein FRX48_05731 [Lasallia pustulata]
MAQHAAFTGAPSIRGYTQAQRMALLTFSLVGLQFTWGVEMTYFTPYLLGLGLAKSQTSLVDRVRQIDAEVGEEEAVYVCLRGHGRGVSFDAGVGGGDCRGSGEGEGETKKRLTVTLAIFCIYAVDFAINAVQATSRSLIVDTLPVSEQQLGSAWAGRMLGLGHVLGYFAGTLNLHAMFGNALGSTQFKQICAIASTTIVFCVGVTCLCVRERVLVEASDDSGKKGAWKVFLNIVKTTMHLPERIRAVCWITFWSWIGWSPFFVYGTTWVGETYYRQSPDRAAELQNSTDVVGDIARRGSIALVLFSIISFAGSVILPFVVSSPSDASEDDESTSTKAVPKRLANLARRLKPYQPDITTAWGLSQVLFGASMILAPISHSFRFATTLIALCGIPWAMYGWAPLAIMGEEINKLEPPPSESAYTRVGQDGPVEVDRLSLDSTHLLAHTTPYAAIAAAASEDADADNGTGDMAGVYLGIWNIFATVPQFIATFISMVAFSILEPGRSPELSGGGKGDGGWRRS